MKLRSSDAHALRSLSLVLTALTMVGCGNMLDDELAEARLLGMVDQPILLDSTSIASSGDEDSGGTGSTWDMGSSAGSFTDSGTGGDTEDSVGCTSMGCATTGCGDMGCGGTSGAVTSGDSDGSGGGESGVGDSGGGESGGGSGGESGGGESGGGESGGGESGGGDSGGDSGGDTGGTCPSEHESNEHVEGDHGGVGPTLPGWKGTKKVDTGTQCNFQNWTDSDGVDPAAPGCHQAYEDAQCGTPTNDRFGEWCDDADTLIETNPAKDVCHSHKIGPGGVGQGKPDVFSCSAYCNGIFGGTTTGHCQVSPGFCGNGVDSAYCACYSPIPLPWPWPIP
jgi:hypothetical protein